MASASFILYHVYPDDDGERVVKGRVQKMEKYGLLPDHLGWGKWQRRVREGKLRVKWEVQIVQIVQVVQIVQIVQIGQIW